MVDTDIGREERHCVVNRFNVMRLFAVSGSVV